MLKRDFNDLLTKLLPPGPAWHRKEGSPGNAVLKSGANQLQQVDTYADSLVDEADPRTASQTFSDWLRVYGIPDDCLKYLENEVIKNRDYNLKNGTDRKIIVVVDEAHLFIDEKYPIALDFMYQLAKRIRKYNGMEIVITQSIKDFAGTPETARKSMAIINVSQYSLIFPLSPSDMNDLCALYEKAGQINEIEADNIVHNERGCAFLISSPESRTNIRIVATPYFEKIFG